MTIRNAGKSTAHKVRQVAARLRRVATGRRWLGTVVFAVGVFAVVRLIAHDPRPVRAEFSFVLGRSDGLTTLALEYVGVGEAQDTAYFETHSLAAIIYHRPKLVGGDYDVRITFTRDDGQRGSVTRRVKVEDGTRITLDLAKEVAGVLDTPEVVE